MNDSTPDPTDEQIDCMLDRIYSLAGASLVDHPQRHRAAEILAAGGHLFARRDDDGHVSLFVGWFADPELRPPDVDALETVKLLRVPRQVLVGASNPSDS